MDHFATAVLAAAAAAALTLLAPAPAPAFVPDLSVTDRGVSAAAP
ncbi:MAG: hypothetical protein AAF677_01195 [Pseudomonadota bacterium]